MPPKRTGTALDEPKEIVDLDPIFPLPKVGAYPGVKQGEGTEILTNTKLMVVELPFRVAWSLWEHVERRAAKEYPQYKGRTDELINHALAQVEGVAAFRSAFLGEHIPILSESEAQSIRDRQAKKLAKKSKKAVQADQQLALALDSQDPSDCPKCGPNRTLLKKKRNGKKIWKCADCGHRWPRGSSGEAPGSRSNGSGASKSGGKGAKPPAKAVRPRKRPAKKR